MSEKKKDTNYFCGEDFYKRWPGKKWGDKLNTIIGNKVVLELDELQKSGVSEKDLLEYMHILEDFKEVLFAIEDFSNSFVEDLFSIKHSSEYEKNQTLLKAIDTYESYINREESLLNKSGVVFKFLRKLVYKKIIDKILLKRFAETIKVNDLGVPLGDTFTSEAANFPGKELKVIGVMMRLMGRIMSVVPLDGFNNTIVIFTYIYNNLNNFKNEKVVVSGDLWRWRHGFESFKVFVGEKFDVEIYPPTAFLKKDEIPDPDIGFKVIIRQNKNKPTNQELLSRVGRKVKAKLDYGPGFFNQRDEKFEIDMELDKIFNINPLFEESDGKVLYFDYLISVGKLVCMNSKFQPDGHGFDKVGEDAALIKILDKATNFFLSKVKHVLEETELKEQERRTKENQEAETLFEEEFEDFEEEQEPSGESVDVSESGVENVEETILEKGKNTSLENKNDELAKSKETKKIRPKFKGMLGTIVKRKLTNICGEPRVNGSHHIFSKTVNGVKVSYPVPIHGSRAVKSIYIKNILEKLEISTEEFVTA
jgi:predicted RNA binding protein YcfA (HicA-like mRNA interferase family)